MSFHLFVNSGTGTEFQKISNYFILSYALQLKFLELLDHFLISDESLIKLKLIR